MEKDDEFMRWQARSDALEERIKFNQHYVRVMQRFRDQLKDKDLKYEKKSTEIEHTCQKIEENQQHSLAPVVNLGKEVGSGCNLSLIHI